MKWLARLVLFAVLILAPAAQIPAQDGPGAPQDGAEVPDDAPEEAADGQREAPEPATELPSAFSGIELGMTVDTVKDRLREDPNFFYRGDPDVTLTPARQQQLIEVDGTLYVDRGFFQFEEEELYIIILQLNRERLDYFTLYTRLSGRYGEPVVFEPDQVVWESDSVRMTLEKPLTVKYVLRPVFDGLVAEGEMERSQREISREEFLEQF